MKVSKSRLRLGAGVVMVITIMPLAVQHGYKAITEAVTYTYVDAKLIKAQALCRVRGQTPKAQRYLDETTPWVNGTWTGCEAARDFLDNGTSRYHQLKLFVKSAKDVATVEYTAPSDQSQRIAQLQMSDWRADVWLVEEEGTKAATTEIKIVKIRAHKSDPEKVMW